MSKLNNIINIAILSYIVGSFATEYSFDAAWFPFISTPASELKSKVSTTHRLESAKHYISEFNSPFQNAVYLTYALVVVLLVSLSGCIARGLDRGVNAITLLLVVAGTVVNYLYAYTALSKIGGKFRPGPQAEAECLRDVAFAHLVGVVCGVLGVVLQMGVFEEAGEVVEDERESFYPYAPKKKGDKKKVEEKKTD